MRQEEEEQPERVTISADGVAAGSTHAFKIVMEEALDQRQEVILLLSSLH
jgi:hypothetical protein